MEQKKYKPVRVPFSKEEYGHIRKLSHDTHIPQDSLLLKKILQESRKEFEKMNKNGLFVTFCGPVKREKEVMIYMDLELYQWVNKFAVKLNVSIPWMTRFVVCPVLPKEKKKPDKEEGENSR